MALASMENKERAQMPPPKLSLGAQKTKVYSYQKVVPIGKKVNSINKRLDCQLSHTLERSASVS